MRKRPLLIWTVLLLLPLLAAGALLVFAPVRALNALGAVAGGYTSREGVPYGPLARQRLDLYIPAADAPAGGWPMVVFFYGGAWNSGARADSRFVAASLAAHGVLTLVADYRLYPEVRYPDFLRDSAQALAGGDAPHLIRIATNSGHGASNLSKALEEIADAYTFTWAAMGITPSFGQP